MATFGIILFFIGLALGMISPVLFKLQLKQNKNYRFIPIFLSSIFMMFISIMIIQF